jgi:hypothetical protein
LSEVGVAVFRGVNRMMSGWKVRRQTLGLKMNVFAVRMRAIVGMKPQRTVQ